MLSVSRHRLATACLQLAVACVVIILAGQQNYARREPGSVMQIGVRTSHKESVANKTFRVTAPPLPKVFVPLSQESVNSVRKFVFFIGWSRSGSSIIGSILDAHPHIVIPHQYPLFEKWKSNAMTFNRKKRYLFNELYKLSYNDVVSGLRKNEEALSIRGYTLNVKGMWQGQFKDYVAVIGNKQAGQVTRQYLTDPANYQQVYKELVETVRIPVVALLVVRNPFDMVARKCIHRLSDDDLNMRELATMKKVYRDDRILKECIKMIMNHAQAIQSMKQDLKLNMTILEVHNSDYVNEPKRTVQRICDFLEVECSEEYLQACEEKAFKSTFRTRQLVEWPPELRTLMEQQMRNVRFFDRYSFDSE